MENKVIHLILARFNLTIRFECETRDGSSVPAEQPWLDSKYLDESFDIFERCTFKAI